MRVLLITQIWPNSFEPTRATYNLQQFKNLGQERDCEVTVLSAVATLPGAALLPKHLRSARVMKLAHLPSRETIEGVETHHMRQLYLPKVGVPLAVPLYLASLVPHRDLLARADVIVGAWAYPDGCAVVLAARALGKPCVIKVHGSDLNEVAKIPTARAVLSRVLPMADAMVSVSAPLSTELEELGVAREKINLIANGVDKSVFSVRDKREARRALGLSETAPLVVFVGRIEPKKGVGELLDAIPRVLAKMPGTVFALIGDGPLTERAKSEGAGLGGAIVAPGARPLREVAQWLAACDVMTLPSWMEGTPNVVLEALASGRPVVASRVGGVPDVLPDPDAGRIVPARDAVALADALVETLARAQRGAFPPDKMASFGPKSWQDNAAALYEVLRGVT